jgi:outer membrane receptor for ferrienterochelin and colicins
MANHRVWGSDVSYEYNHPQDRWKAATYGSIQYTDRESYYGSSESPFPDKQYGNSTDASVAVGGQLSFRWLKLRSVMMIGTEYLSTRVADVYPGFLRQINQTVSSSGNYFQWQVDPHKKWMITSGLRYDFVRIVGNYDFDGTLMQNNKLLEVPNLRFTTKFKARSNWDLRMNLATGYRAPQAFDEDLHIDVVGGNPRFIRLAENLQAERSLSGSFTSDIDWKRSKGKWEFIQEVFVTQLNRPFVLADLQATSSGVLIAEKRNGSGAQVAGLNVEFRYVNEKNNSLEFGITWQKAVYEKMELLWEDLNMQVATDKILRTPNLYGFLSGNFQVKKRITLSYSAVYTGSMLVTHVVDGNTGKQELKNTPEFLDIGLKCTYRLLEKKRIYIESEIGIQNLLNSYQRDFDNGISRDAAYVYGPMRPTTLIFSIKMGSRRP